MLHVQCRGGGEGVGALWKQPTVEIYKVSDFHSSIWTTWRLNTWGRRVTVPGCFYPFRPLKSWYRQFSFLTSLILLALNFLVMEYSYLTSFPLPELLGFTVDFLCQRVFNLISISITPSALLPIGQKVFITWLPFYFVSIPSSWISLTGSIHSFLASLTIHIVLEFLFIYLTSFPPAELLSARLPGTEAALAAGQTGDEFPGKKER